MVCFDVYDSIFDYLYKNDIFDKLEEFIGLILKPLSKKINLKEFNDEMMIEFSLFNFFINGVMLIDYLKDNLYKELDKYQKKEFDLIHKSERYEIELMHKKSRNEIDRNGEELYDVYFKDINSKKEFIVVSAYPFEKLDYPKNARLIPHTIHEERFIITGVIIEYEIYKILEISANYLHSNECYNKSLNKFNSLLEFSRNNTLKAIESYDDKESLFLEKDKEIMKINKGFIDCFGIGFDVFLNDFFNLSSKKNFIKMCKHFTSVADKLYESIFDTNYVNQIKLFYEKEIISAFAYFKENDVKAMEKAIKNMIEEARVEFQNNKNNALNMSREKIISNQKKNLIKFIKPMKIEGFDEFYNDINKYQPEQIEDFLSEIISFYIQNKTILNNESHIFSLRMLESFAKSSKDIPYLKDVKKVNNSCKFIESEFYNFLTIDKELRNIYFLVYIAFLSIKGMHEKAYNLIKNEIPKKIDSFELMFETGKILSRFDDNKYKSYFKKAKSLNKNKYKIELENFLIEKEKGI